MLSTFNCGVGFCLITPKKNVKKIKTFFFQRNLLPMKSDVLLKVQIKLNC